MDTELKGKTALITGGSSGIGKGIALALAGEGVTLAIASRNPYQGAIDEISARGVKCFRIAADVSREEEVVRMVGEAIKSLGHLDFYINNAAWTWHQPVTKIETDSWYKTINTNLSAAMWGCREVAKHMIPRRAGGIVIIGSTVHFFPAYQETSYRISKMGLIMLMQNLAIELAPYNIRVNMVTPGHFQTRMTGNIPEDEENRLREIIPLQRFGNPVDIGNAVVFLLSDRLSGYTVGAELVVDGGLSMNPFVRRSEKELLDMNQ